jgi:hypothetical protein
LVNLLPVRDALEIVQIVVEACGDAQVVLEQVVTGQTAGVVSIVR